MPVEDELQHVAERWRRYPSLAASYLSESELEATR